MSLCGYFARICSGFRSLTINPVQCNVAQRRYRLFKSVSVISVSSNKFHTTPQKCGLNEFFDEEKNWGASEVRVGRSWKVDELRIKSNVDLHKLWYVLLKERNMLLTMQHEYEEKNMRLPSEERLYKVKESMANLETVVRERNRAYHELEVGDTGERPVVRDTNCFGLPCTRKLRQNHIESKHNKSFQNYYRLRYQVLNWNDVNWFLQRYNEKQRRQKFLFLRRRFRKVCGLLKRFPDLDEESLKAEYPEVDIEEARRHKDSRGPRINPY